MVRLSCNKKYTKIYAIHISKELVFISKSVEKKEESYKEEFLRINNIQNNEDLKNFIKTNRKPVNMALFVPVAQ